MQTGEFILLWNEVGRQGSLYYYGMKYGAGRQWSLYYYGMKQGVGRQGSLYCYGMKQGVGRQGSLYYYGMKQGVGRQGSLYYYGMKQGVGRQGSLMLKVKQQTTKSLTIHFYFRNKKSLISSLFLYSVFPQVTSLLETVIKNYQISFRKTMISRSFLPR